MSFKEQLLNDLKEAMKTKDTIRKDTIQIVRAGILQIEKDKKIELDDTGIVEVIAKEVKRRYDVLPDYERSGRLDLIDGLKKEIQILNHYLPEQLTEDEVKTMVQETIAELDAKSMKDMGKVMSALKDKLAGRADGTFVSACVKQMLGSISPKQ